MIKNQLLIAIQLGMLFFSIQLAWILILCPEPTLAQAWLSLGSHWDSEWYEAIAQYGYVNTDGPLHSGLRNANVVFFPGYPYLASGLVTLFGISAKTAILLIAQTACGLFWILLFYILKGLPLHKKILAGGLIFVFPTEWFMYMGYSESLFILCACATLQWIIEKKWLLSSSMGFLMTATRLLGLPILAVPVFFRFIKDYGQRQTLLTPLLWFGIGASGCIAFLGYCEWQFHSWHLYFDMEKIHWKGTADPFFLFKKATWIPPPWGYTLDFAPILPDAWPKMINAKFFRPAAYSFSEILVPIFMGLELLYGYLLLKKSMLGNEKIVIWYGASIFLLLLSCFSLSTRYYESMSRCLLPVWILFIIGDALNPQSIFLNGGFKGKMTGIMFILLMSFGFWLQLLQRFFIGWWVA